MRHIVLDTETTGLDPASGHRIVEIGCVELVNHIPTGRIFHHYLNPERDMPREAEQVHGLSADFLKDKPRFADIAASFMEFIGDDPLMIHNAGFDMAFLNAELAAFGLAALMPSRVIDTVAIARRKFPGSPASLDALCKRFSIDASARDYHGALLDARLLADVYLELSGGRQTGFAITFASARPTQAQTAARGPRAARVFAPDAAELEAHAAAMQGIPGNLWD